MIDTVPRASGHRGRAKRETVRLTRDQKFMLLLYKASLSLTEKNLLMFLYLKAGEQNLTNSMSIPQIQKALNVKATAIYKAFSGLRDKWVKEERGNSKYTKKYSLIIPPR